MDARDQLFGYLKDACLTKTPVSHKAIKRQLESIGFKVKYAPCRGEVFRRGCDFILSESGHFTQWLTLNNKKYAAITYTAVKEGNSFNIYVSQCLTSVCPRYLCTPLRDRIVVDLSIKADIFYDADGNERIVFVDDTFKELASSINSYRYYNCAVISMIDGRDKCTYEYTKSNGDKYRETYTKNDDGSYTAQILDITHLECEERQFYIMD